MTALTVSKSISFFPGESQFQTQADQDKAARFVDIGRNPVIALYFNCNEGSEISEYEAPNSTGDCKANTEQHEWDHGIFKSRIDELREKGNKEQRNFRIEDVCENGIPVYLF